ncbi:3-hydroxyacyl-ACP dehydratase FabZ [Oscillospiraceae bacterium HV4-5-C5C]|nr:3-hydroxyacyl-ACP dehydratase FabZ [Oscillospiraceae bacterium HV4-5-C5C]
MMNQEQIKAIIPHRDPFLLVDEILELDENRVVGLKHVTGQEDFFRGHFPGAPVMPGVLILEAIAQAGAVCILSKPEFRGKLAYFGGMEKVRFRKPVFPGCDLTLQMELTKSRGRIGFGLGKAYVGTQLMAQAEMSFAVMDRPEA